MKRFWLGVGILAVLLAASLVISLIAPFIGYGIY